MSSLCGLAALALATLAASPATAQISIGQVLPLSGPVAAVGAAKRAGAEAYIQQVNRAGGVGGKQIELVVKDDGYVPERTVAAFRELNNTKVLAILGMLGAPNTAAVGPVAQELKLPVVGITDSSGRYKTTFNRYMFPLRASSADESLAIARHLNTVGVASAAIVSVNLPIGKVLHEAMKGALDKTAIKVDGEFVLAADGSNGAEVAKALGASNVNVVMLATHTPATLQFLKVVAAQGVHKQFFATSATDPIQAYNTLKSGATWLIGTQVVPAPGSQRHRVAKEYVAALKVLQGDAAVPSFFGLEAYVEAKVLVEALKRSRGAGRDGLVSALETMRSFDTGGVMVHYGEELRTGSGFVELVMVSKNGRMLQ